MAVRKTEKVPKVITSGDLVLAGRNIKASAKLLEIVNAASELFHWKGYGATTTRDIGKACGISQGHLYYYIKSKEDIPGMFVAIQDHEVDNWEKAVRRGFGKLPPEKLLQKAVRQYTELVHLRRKMVTFWYHAAIQVRPEQSAAIRQNEIRVVEYSRKYSNWAIRRGNFK